MILKTLTLKNFRKFKNTVIEFPDGVTGVVGLNGVGKSTIFEAIAWVLYGSVAARTSADQIKRESAEKSDSCRVELDFIFEDETYRIVREMKGKGQTVTAIATINGKVAATGTEPVNKYIQKTLGMDFRSFYTSIFAKQKELNALSSMNASERRPLILRMLGIDSLDIVIKEIKSDKKNKDTLIKNLEADLVDERGKSKTEKYKNEVEKLKKQKQETNNGIKKSKEKLIILKNQLKALDKNYSSNKSDFEKINKKREELQEKRTLYENKNKLQDEITKLQAKMDERQKRIDTQVKKLKEFKDTDAQIKKSNDRLKTIDSAIENQIKKIEQKKTIVENIKKQISEIGSKKTNIEKLGPQANCPTCERVLESQYNKLLKKFAEEITKKEKEIKNFSKEIKESESQKDKVLREKQALQKKINYLQGLLREKERFDTTISNLQKELKVEKTELERKKKQIEKIGSVKFDSKEFEKIKKQVENLYTKYQKSLELVNQKKDQIGEAKLELEKKEGMLNLTAQELKNLNEKIQELKEFKNKINDEKKSIQYLRMLAEAMSLFRTHLISRIRPTLSAYASDFFERLTDGKYTELELDENYDIMVYDEGKLYDIERFSGGEEDLANLCLRLSISEVITERAGGVFNFIVLDEIFGSQDFIRRQNIMKALNGLSSKFRQIFLITHIEELKNDMENVIYVSEKQDGISSIKIE